MRILGLDLSTKAGVSVTDVKKPGHVLFAETVTFPKLEGFERVNAIAARILEIRDEHCAQIAMIEDYAVSKFGGSAIVSIEIGTVIRFLFWQESFPFMDVSPTTLKKFVIGHGGKGSTKDLMLMHVMKKFGHESKTNDEADAVALGMLGLVCWGGLSYGKPEAECVISCRKQNPAFKFPSVA